MNELKKYFVAQAQAQANIKSFINTTLKSIFHASSIN